MNPDDIRSALEIRRLVNERGVNEALKQREHIEQSGINIAQVQQQAALARERNIDRVTREVNVKPLLETIELLRRPLPPEWMQAKSEMDQLLLSLGRGVTEVRDAINAVAREPLRQFLERWQMTNEQLRELTRIRIDTPLAVLVRTAADVYEMNAAAVAQQIKKRDLINADPLLGARLTLPSVGYADFNRRTIERIGQTADEDERSALGGSLVIAQEQITRSTDLIVGVTSDLELTTGPVVENEAAGSNYNVYDAAQQDLLSRDRIPDPADYESLRELSVSAALAERTRAMLHAVIRCNQNCRLRGGEDIFKLTNALADACVSLPGLIVRDEGDLRNLIFYLYMVFYEGAGKDKLRYIERGYVTGGDCGVVWTLKSLRNKWHEHDAEHGKEADVQANYRKLNEALGDLGYDRFPREPREFTDVQQKLIARLADLTAKIESGVVAGPTSPTVM